MKTKRLLVLSDIHAPYAHKDTLAFLKEIKSTYKPDKVISVGDEVDGQALSYHESNPDLPSAGDELEEAIEFFKPIYNLFPTVDLVDSNHGSLVYRKAHTAGIPRAAIKGYREILRAPKGWNWHTDLTLTLSDGNRVYIHHSKGANDLRTSQSTGFSFIQGHHHEKFSIQYWGNSLGLYWAMTVGCLIDDKALAFNYNKCNLKRPIVGLGMVIDGQPKLIPMVLDRHARWTGKL